MRTVVAASLVALAVVGLVQGQTPLDASFTYQGRLRSGGSPASGNHAFEFSLWDAAGSGNPPTGGNQIGTTQSLSAVSVNQGLFTVLLNAAGEFGPSAFNGDQRWLQVVVDGTSLSPRQALAPTPYAAAVRGLRPVPTSGPDQAQEGATTTYTLPIWQSFTAGRSGLLTAVDIGTQFVSDTPSTVIIYDGTGTGGAQLANVGVTVLAGDRLQRVDLPTPPTLIAGHTYTIWAAGGLDQLWRIASGNPYAGGVSNVGPDYDLNFRTIMFTSDGNFAVDRDVVFNGVASFGESVSIGAAATSPPMSLEVTRSSYYGQPTLGVASGGDYLYLLGGPVHALVWNNTASLRFSTEASRGGGYVERMRITGNGNVGIGTDAPDVFTLAVNGLAGKPGGGSWDVFCDSRLKRDIAPMHGTLDRLLALHGYTFEYVPEAVEKRLALPGPQFGLLADEVERVFPDWIGRDKEGYRYLSERGVTALLVEGLRDLRTEKDKQMEALKAENAELRSRLERIEKSLAGLATESNPKPH